MRYFIYNEMLFVYRKFMPDLPRCTSVDFFEHLVEQFVVRETVSFDDFHDTVLCVAVIMVNMNQADLVDVPRERHTEALFKEAAEIFPA